MASNICPISGSLSDSASNRRLAIRTNCSILASIKLNGVLICDCVIKDISETGMRLYTGTGSWLPNNFETHIPEFEAVLKVRKEWTTDEYLGVSFVTN